MSETPSLHEYGFLVPRGTVAADPGEAAVAARRIGFPVALKVVSPDILHKTEVGGVVLGLTSEEAVRAAADTMLATVAARAPEARVEGLLVEEMSAGRGSRSSSASETTPSSGP